MTPKQVLAIAEQIERRRLAEPGGPLLGRLLTDDERALVRLRVMAPSTYAGPPAAPPAARGGNLGETGGLTDATRSASGH